jgi:cysteine synthase B
MTKQLAQDAGIFAGISSGAAVRTAQRVAERMDSGKIVALLADGGWKYLSTGLWTRDYADIIEDIGEKLWW